MIRLVGNSVSTFQWSNSEQVWPFEKSKLGYTLYCKEIAFGTLPNSAVKQVAHGITELAADVKRLFKEQYIVTSNGQSFPAANPSPASCIASIVYGGNIYVQTGVTYSAGTTLTARLIYSKV